MSSSAPQSTGRFVTPFFYKIITEILTTETSAKLRIIHNFLLISLIKKISKKITNFTVSTNQEIFFDNFKFMSFIPKKVLAEMQIDFFAKNILVKNLVKKGNFTRKIIH